MGRLLTVEWLQAAVRAREADRGGTISCDLRQVVGAFAVLRELLGQEWLQARLDLTKTGSFLNPSRERDLDTYKVQDRVVALAELLFNLQLVEGFGLRLKDLETVDVETALAELEGARLLLTSNISFGFVTPRGVKGTDYDVEALIGATTVPCEMKAKLEITSAKASSVVDTLRRARDQLPEGRPSIVFLRVPETWVSDEQGRTAIEAGLRQALRNTGRIARVVLHWEEWRSLELGALRTTHYSIHSNPNARTQLSALDNMLEAAPSSTAGGWIDFHDALCESEDLPRSRLLEIVFQTDAWVRGQRPPPPVLMHGVLYRGNLAVLRSIDPAALLTIVDFECQGFELFELARSADPSIPAGATLTVRLTKGSTVAELTVCPGGRAGVYQLQMGGLIHDEALNAEGTGTAPPLEREAVVRAAVQAGKLEELDDGDVFVRVVRQIFAAMREEGDLVRPTHLLTGLHVWYRLRDMPEVLYEVRYHNRPILV